MAAEAKNMKEWALHYAEMGLAVFPLVCRDKVPAVVGGCKVATTERTTIERWWDKNPQYNIGIATGNKSSGLVVIDLDVDKNKGIDGYDVLRDWQNKHGKLPETWQSITGRGGYHYFYKDAIVHSNRVGLYEGVDIRGEALLRKIVREESGGQQSSGNYRFTAQINRRTVFDEIIEEAKLRRSTSGRNPFELA